MRAHDDKAIAAIRNLLAHRTSVGARRAELARAQEAFDEADRDLREAHADAMNATRGGRVYLVSNRYWMVRDNRLIEVEMVTPAISTSSAVGVDLA